MCLTLVAWQAHPVLSLVIAANRDEVYWRATDPLHWWDEARRILAGRDRPSGGTWMGITDDGRFAAVTNVRNGPPGGGPTPVGSRGNLPTDFLRSDSTPQVYATDVHAAGEKYRGFNLICSDFRELWWVSNRSRRSPRKVESGIHGLSNAALDTPWPKVVGGKDAFTKVLAVDDGSSSAVPAYFDLLRDAAYAPREKLPKTGVGLLAEKLLSARFVRMGIYGTRSSTVLRVRHDGSFDMTERRFGRWGQLVGETPYAGAAVKHS